MHNGHDCMCFRKNQTSEMVKIAYPRKLNPLKIPVIWYNVLLCVTVNLCTLLAYTCVLQCTFVCTAFFCATTLSQARSFVSWLLVSSSPTLTSTRPPCWARAVTSTQSGYSGNNRGEVGVGYMYNVLMLPCVCYSGPLCRDTTLYMIVQCIHVYVWRSLTETPNLYLANILDLGPDCQIY